MGLRFDPMGGGQLKQALTSIIEAEKVPITALTKRKETETNKLKLFRIMNKVAFHHPV